MQATVYIIRSAIDYKVYVGSTVDLKNRWKCHRSALRSGRHHSRHLQSAWNKYGEVNFSFHIVAACAVQDRVKTEQVWIDRHKSYLPKFGYNICRYAESVVGRKHSEETKLKMSVSTKGKIRTPEHRRNISLCQMGKQVSEETRRKLSTAGKGRVFNPESIRKSAEARKGFKHTDAAKQRMREKAVGRTISEEARRKISEAGKGRKWTDEQRLKMQNVARKQRTVEQRERVSKARGGRNFKVTSPSGEEFVFGTLTQAKESLGLDQSNVHKCLLNKAQTTKGYRCEYCP